MKRLALVLLGMALAFNATAQQGTKTAAKTSGGANLPTQATVDEFMHHTFGYDPNLKWRVTQIKPAEDPSLAEVDIVMNTPEGQQPLKLFVTPDHKYAISGDFLPFGADPFAPVRNLLNEKGKGPWRGAANPAVTIVEFGDLQCPACKRAQPTIEKLMNEVPNAKLVFQLFPIAQLHPWAETAARYATCVDKQSRPAFWKFIDTVYQNQDAMEPLSVEQVQPKLKQYAADSGVNADKVQQCTEDPAIAAEVFRSEELGHEVDVTGTPTLFLNGRKIGNVGGIPYETLKAIADFQAQSK